MEARMNDKGRSRHVRRRFLPTIFLISVACWELVPCALCQTDNLIPLWPLSAPMAKSAGVDDNPAISLYLPAAHRPTAGVIICPPGQYMSLSLDRDGRQVAEWLNKLGIAAFVLRYRSPPPITTPCRCWTRRGPCATFAPTLRFITLPPIGSALWDSPLAATWPQWWQRTLTLAGPLPVTASTG